MSLRKAEINISLFEKNVSNAITGLLIIAFVISSILFGIIAYQKLLQKKSLITKDIENTINLYQFNLSEKLSIIVSSPLFLDFLTSGSATRTNIEAKFLTELLPLRSSGIVGYTLKNTDTKIDYNSGLRTNQYIKLRLCYLADKLDTENGNCYGLLQLYFNEDQIIHQLVLIKDSIRSCKTCNKYNLIKTGKFGNFQLDADSKLTVNIGTTDTYETIIFYYFLIIFILISFALFNKSKIKKMLNTCISHPLESMISVIKSQSPITINPNALQEINYLGVQIEADRLKLNKLNEFEKKAAIGHLAAQVAHDIRSPLAVMEIVLSDLNREISNTQFCILNQAIQSVRDIAGNLLNQHHNHTKFISQTDNSNQKRFILFSSLVEHVVTEK